MERERERGTHQKVRVWRRRQRERESPEMSAFGGKREREREIGEEFRKLMNGLGVMETANGGGNELLSHSLHSWRRRRGPKVWAA